MCACCMYSCVYFPAEQIYIYPDSNQTLQTVNFSLFFFFCFYCLFPTSVYLVMCVQLYQICPFHEVKLSVWSHLVLSQ